jgi:hypothetical protein
MKKRQLEVSTEALVSIIRAQPKGISHTICRGEQMGAWLSVLLSTVNGTKLSAQEFRGLPYSQGVVEIKPCAMPLAARKVVSSFSDTTKYKKN